MQIFCHFSVFKCSSVIRRKRLPSIRDAFVRTLSVSVDMAKLASNNRDSKSRDMSSYLSSVMLLTRASVTVASAHDDFTRTEMLLSGRMRKRAPMVFSMKQISAGD